MEKEIWKIIPSSDGKYAASTMGRVKNVKYDRILSPVKITHGYIGVSLSNKQRIAHRVIAETFLPSFSKKLEVNHKNFDKTDNRISNLEMVSRSANMAHYLETLEKRTCLRCLKTFRSFKKAPRLCGFCDSKYWNIPPVKRICKKCTHEWIQKSQNKSRQCSNCWTNHWE